MVAKEKKARKASRQRETRSHAGAVPKWSLAAQLRVELTAPTTAKATYRPKVMRPLRLEETILLAIQSHDNILLTPLIGLQSDIGTSSNLTALRGQRIYLSVAKTLSLLHVADRGNCLSLG